MLVNSENKPIAKKVGIVIQARQASKRFPDKWKADLDGIPMIQHVMERSTQLMQNCAIFFRGAPFSFKVICAIPEGDNDLKKWLTDNKYEVFEGDPDDVLKRYHKCSLKYGLSFVVRITGDCPLLSPSVGASIVNASLIHQLDYCSNTVIRSHPDGWDVEVISERALQYLFSNAKGEEREHVTSHLLNTANCLKFSEKYKFGQFTYDLDLSHIKISVDTEADLAYVFQELQKIKEKKEAVYELVKKSAERDSTNNPDKQQKTN